MATSGVVVDCGSGHTSVMFYTAAGGVDGAVAVSQQSRAWLKHADGGNLPLTDIIPGAPGGAFRGETLAERLDEFLRHLEGVLDEQHSRDGSPPSEGGGGDGAPSEGGGDGAPPPPPPDRSILFVGATGGVREAVEQGRLSEVEQEDDVAHT